MTTTAPPTTACLRFIEDGLTLDGQVWRSGAVCETANLKLALLDPDQQRSRWGIVYFEIITPEEYAVLKDAPAVNLRSTRRATATPPPPATGYDAQGDPLHVDPGKATPLAGQAHTLQPIQLSEDPEKLAAKGVTPELAAASTWAWYDGANDIETIQHLAGMGEVELDKFLSHEREHRNRAGIIRLIQTGEM